MRKEVEYIAGHFEDLDGDSVSRLVGPSGSVYELVDRYLGDFVFDERYIDDKIIQILDDEALSRPEKNLLLIALGIKMGTE
jgi:hypothetical protein